MEPQAEVYTCDYANKGNTDNMKEPDIFRRDPPKRCTESRKAVEEVNRSNADKIATKYNFPKDYLLRVAGYDDTRLTISERRARGSQLSHKMKNKVIRFSGYILDLSEFTQSQFFLEKKKRSTDKMTRYRALFVGVLHNLGIKQIVIGRIANITDAGVAKAKKKHQGLYQTDKKYRELFDNCLEFINL